MSAQKSITARKRLLDQLGRPVLIFTVAVFVVLGGEVFLSFTRARAEAVKRPQTILRSAQREVEDFFHSLERDIRITATSAAQDLTFSPRTSFFLQTVIRENPALLGLQFFDENGTELARFVEPTVGGLLERGDFGRGYFDAVRSSEDAVLFPPKLSIYNTPVVTWAFPIKDSFGDLRGVVTGTIDVSALWGILSSYRETSPGELYLIDGEGTLLVSNDFAEVERQSSLLYIEGVRAFLGGENQVQEYAGLSGFLVAGIAEVAHPTSWLLVAEMPLPLLLRDLRQRVYIIIFLMVVLFILFVYEAYVFKKVLLTPVDQLIRTTQRIAAGNLRERVNIASANEISVLGSDFNRMADSLQMSYIQLEDQIKELKELDQLKDNFLNNTTHELKSPLIPIKSQSQLLLEDTYGALNAEQKESVEMILRNEAHLESVVGDVMDISKLRSKKIKFTFNEEGDLGKIIENAVKDMVELAKKRSITLVLKPMPELPKIRLDERRITQVIDNLLHNALKFTPAKGRITVKVEKGKKDVTVSVADTGIGMSAETLEKLFTPFFQADSDAARRYPGTGLGLSISKGFVEAHGGSIRAESQGEEKGSTLSFTLPL